MENQKSSGLFGKLFASKQKDCCSVQIEEVRDDVIDREAPIAPEEEEVGASRKATPTGVDNGAGCCLNSTE